MQSFEDFQDCGGRAANHMQEAGEERASAGADWQSRMIAGDNEWNQAGDASITCFKMGEADMKGGASGRRRRKQSTNQH